MKKTKFRKKRVIFILSLIILTLSVLFLFFIRQDNCEKKDLSMCRMKIDGHNINLKVAYSDRIQQFGLMWVGDLEKNIGMIFIYDQPRYLSFWMKNTLIPLSIAFIEKDGRISSIENMYPQPGKADHQLPLHQSTTLVKYAIETNVGWFTERGIRPGAYVKIPAKLK